MAKNETPAYTIVDYNGKKARQYPNGAIRDTNGRILKAQPGFVEEHSIQDGDKARALTRKRWEKYQRAAARAVADEIGSIYPGANTPFAAWGVLNAKTAQAIMDSDKPRGRDLEYIGRNIGAVRSPADVDDGDNGSPDPTRDLIRDLADIARAAMAQRDDNG